MSSKQPLFLLAGASGSGKTGLVNALVRERPHQFVKFITTTARPMRPKERHGEDYYFTTQNDFEKMMNWGAFFEHNFFKGSNKHYGCTYLELERFKNSKKIPIAAVDLEGAKKFLGLTQNGFIDLSRVQPFVLYIRTNRNELIRRLVYDNEEGAKRNDSPYEMLNRIKTIDLELSQEHLFHEKAIVSNEFGQFDFALNESMNKILHPKQLLTI